MHLKINGLEAGYGRKKVIRGVTFQVEKDQIVGIFGHNGAGKTTLFWAIMGHIAPTAGSITMDQQDISHWPVYDKAKYGLRYIPAEKGVFSELTVYENLIMGFHSIKDTPLESRLQIIYQIFPILEKRKKQMAGSLSGGEQHMLAIAIGLIANPKILMLDEPSLGLSPLLVQRVMEAVKNINQEHGIGIIVAEQNIRSTLPITRKAYFIKLGEMVFEEDSDKLIKRGNYWDLL